MEAMPITPDTKDWTWTLERRCPECGFDASTSATADVPRLIRENASRWQDVLRQNARTLTARPNDHTWSPLEYACHVRDVYRLYDWRIQRMQHDDGVRFPNWNQDDTATTDRYNEQQPANVAEQLATAGHALATRLEGIADPEWQRRGYRSDGAAFTIDTIVRYMIHDPIHHLHDVTDSPGA